MRIKFKRLHPNAVLPHVAHSRDYGFDCVAVTEEEIAPGVWRYGLGFALQIDKKTTGVNDKLRIALYARSSIHKTGMVLSNGIGIVDEGYRGEISAVFYHVMPSLPRYKVGDRICRIAVEGRPDFQYYIEVDELDNGDRGSNGYGSTGK